MEEQDSPIGGLGAMQLSMNGPMMAGTEYIDELASKPIIDPANKWRRYAAASIAPTRGGTFAESFAASLDAYSGADEKEAELRAKYLPIIAQALLQRQMQAVTMQQNQFKLTKEWDALLTGGLTGLMSQGNAVTPETVRAMVVGKVQQQQVPGDFAQQWLKNMPDPAQHDLTSWARGKTVASMGDDARLPAVSDKPNVQDVGGRKVILNENPNAPGGVRELPGGGIPNTLTPKDKIPGVQSTSSGLVITAPTTGKSAIAGTPEAQAVTEEALGTGQGGAPSRSAASDPARLKSEETYGGDFGKYRADLDDKVTALADLNTRIGESRNLVKEFRTGAAGEMRTRIAAWTKDVALTAGLSQAQADAIATKVAGGDVSSAQAFEKLAVQGAMEALKSAAGPGQRFTQMEYQQFANVGNPNLKTDPRAMEKIQNFLAEQYRKSAAEQKFVTDEYTAGASLSSIRTRWAQAQAAANPPSRSDNMSKGSARNSKPSVTPLGTSLDGRKMKQVNGVWEYE